MNVTVTVAGSHLGKIEDVAARLRSAGMQVDAVLGAVGIITGSLPRQRLSSIEALQGVAAVEQQVGFQIAPPDAEVQ